MLGVLARGAGLLLAAAFVALLGYGVLTNAPDTTIDDALARGEPPPAPGFSLAAFEDGHLPQSLERTWGRAARDATIDLRELRGTPVVLNVWASWCVPCREEAPVLERGWQRAREQGVLFVGLNQQDVSDDARDFIAEFGLTFAHVRDPTNETSRHWGVGGIPETFFIDARGRIVGHVVGVVSPDQLRSGVAAAAAGRTQTATRGGDQRPTR